MTNKEEPEKILEIFSCRSWDNKEDLIKGMTDKLKEFGYSTSDSGYPNAINIICEHKKPCRLILFATGLPSPGEWTFDISDADTIRNRCKICRKRKTIKYMFDGDALKFWDGENDTNSKVDIEEIDLNDLVDWDRVNNKAIDLMKEKYPKGTIFVDTDNEN